MDKEEERHTHSRLSNNKQAASQPHLTPNPKNLINNCSIVRGDWIFQYETKIDNRQSRIENRETKCKMQNAKCEKRRSTNEIAL